MTHFNPAAPIILLLDINSCFATVEQQANPRLRGKPVAVAAYTTPGGCILAASREAKKDGVRTGMRVSDGRRLSPHLIVLPSDPEKYRFVNRQMVALLSSYTDDIRVESIDEMVLNLRHSVYRPQTASQMIEIAKEIKEKIRKHIGEWITVSIGIAPNQYLAKIASNAQKPDGLVAITQDNILSVLGSMELEDLSGIKTGLASRLRRAGIYTPLAMYHATPKLLAHALHSRTGYDWWGNLHGWEVPWRTDEIKTIGHSFALGKARFPSEESLHQILSQLVVKTGRRLRANGFRTSGVAISCFFDDHTSWGHRRTLRIPLFRTEDIYIQARDILNDSPAKPVRILAVTCFSLTPDVYAQQTLLGQDHEKESLTRAIDTIEDRWGEFTVIPARMLAMEQKVLDRIAFGGMRGRPRV